MDEKLSSNTMEMGDMNAGPSEVSAGEEMGRWMGCLMGERERERRGVGFGESEKCQETLRLV